MKKVSQIPEKYKYSVFREDYTENTFSILFGLTKRVRVCELCSIKWRLLVLHTPQKGCVVR